MKRSFAALAAIFGMALICIYCAAADEKIPKLSDVPDDLGDTKVVELNQRRVELLKERAQLKAKVIKHEEEAAEKGTSAATDLHHEGDVLRTQKQAHIEASKKFNQDVAAAAASAGIQPADKEALQLMQQRLEVNRSRAKAFAAWKLGVYLLESGQTGEAIGYLKEARQFYADPNSHENEALNRLIYDPQKQQEVRSDLFLSAMFPKYQSQAEVVLDALDYGKGNWDQSVKYLEVVGHIDPKNLAARDALNYVRGITTEERSRKR